MLVYYKIRKQTARHGSEEGKKRHFSCTLQPLAVIHRFYTLLNEFCAIIVIYNSIRESTNESKESNTKEQLFPEWNNQVSTS